jgi:Uma2 family endonuclease
VVVQPGIYRNDDRWDFPDDGKRRELIDGVLYVTSAPRRRHQWVVTMLTYRIMEWIEQHGGKVYPTVNVDFEPYTHFEPDVAFIRPEHDDGLEGLGYDFPPDVVVEVSSPSTRRYDLGVKLERYGREGAPEFWFVDLDSDEVLVHRLRPEGGYGEPERYGRGDSFTSPQLPGLTLDVGDLGVRGQEQLAEDVRGTRVAENDTGTTGCPAECATFPRGHHVAAEGSRRRLSSPLPE